MVSTVSFHFKKKPKKPQCNKNYTIFYFQHLATFFCHLTALFLIIPPKINAACSYVQNGKLKIILIFF